MKAAPAGRGARLGACCLLSCAAGLAQAKPARHTVDIEAMAYAPAVLTVHDGDVVTWRNKDAFPHTASAGRRFDTGPIASGGARSVTVRGKGRVEYVCTLHPGMKAVVIVR